MQVRAKMVKIDNAGQLVLSCHHFNPQCAFQILLDHSSLYRKSATDSITIIIIRDLVILGIAERVPQAPEFVETSLRAQFARPRVRHLVAQSWLWVQILPTQLMRVMEVMPRSQHGLLV